MIELIDVSKYYVTEFGKHYVFRDVSLMLPPDRSIGVMGPNGAGKSTFLRLIAGADMPSDGTIIRSGRISPPMGLTPGLQGSMTAAENARFAGRIYGLGRDEINDMIEYVRQTANIGKYFDEQVNTYSAGMKQRVSFAINMSMNFDYYLFDEIGAGGDKEFRKMAREMVLERLRTARFVLTSHRTRDLLEFCQSGIVIRDGGLAFFDDIDEAVKFYGDDDNDDGGLTSAKQERRRTREERRRLREEKAAAPARAAPEQAPLRDLPALTSEAELIPQPVPAVPALSAEADKVETAEAEESAQELRRQKREELRRARAAAAGAEAAGAGEPVTQATPAAETRAALETLPEAAPEADGKALESARRSRAAELSERRRLRREARERSRAEAAEAAETAPAENAPVFPEPAVPAEPVADAQGELVAEADEPDTGSREAARAARRAAAGERRRRRRAERESGATAAEQAAAPDAPPLELPAEAGREEARTARRATAERRRQRGELSEDLPAPAGAPGGEDMATAVVAPVPERDAAPQTARQLSVAQTGGPFAVPAASAPSALSSDDASGAWQGGGRSERGDADRKLLLIRLLLRQDRAQAKASRAARLLLQHLEAPASETARTRSGRAMLVKAAQDIAAAEAAAARALLEQALATGGGGAEAVPPRPGATSPAILAGRMAT